jgi:sugar/nucleoside kinase (ribokinase family)
MSESKLDVVGIGNAIVDVLAEVGDNFLEENGMVKGTMALIDAGQALELNRNLEKVMERSGGSAANTITGITSLGGCGGFIGRVRNDALGESFARDIQASGVEFSTAAATDGPGTGRCVVLVTPDAQRTMQTFLGACAALSTTDLDEEMIGQAAVTYLEGYMWDPPQAKEAFLRAAEIAHDAGKKVSLTLSDPFCVERHRADFLDLIGKHIDILFGNESEILSLYQTSDLDSALEQVGKDCELTAVTLGADGAAVVGADSVKKVPAAKVGKVVDTTGAGDLFAAGFLFGITHDLDPLAAARIGGIAAAEIISHFGARPEQKLSELLA